MLREVRIVGDAKNRKRFKWERLETTKSQTGTRFVAEVEDLKRVARIENDATRNALASTFAPVLLDEADLVVNFLGSDLEVRSQIVADVVLQGSVSADGGDHEYALRIIEWKAGNHRRMYFGEKIGRAVAEVSRKDLDFGTPFSVYLTWPGLVDHAPNVGLGEMAPTPLGEIIRDAAERIRRHFADKRRAMRKKRLADWKRTGVYPFPKEVSGNDSQRVERALFDVVSGTLSEHIPSERDTEKLTLLLLQQALRHDPGTLTRILHEIVVLPKEDRENLARLMDSISLEGVVRAASSVADRSRLLVALDHIVYDPQDSKIVNERDHLHKILENELWVFGEQYNYMRSERGLTEALRTHLRLTGLPSSGRMVPVKRSDGRAGRLDLHLAVKAEEHQRVRHLVIELKDPALELTKEHFDQVEDYCAAILDEPRFASGNARWDFVLVGRSLHRRAEVKILDGHELTGLFLDPPKREEGQPAVRAYARTWRSLIDDNKTRLKFFRDALDDDPSVDESLEYLRRAHAAALPDALVEISVESGLPRRSA